MKLLVPKHITTTPGIERIRVMYLSLGHCDSDSFDYIYSVYFHMTFSLVLFHLGDQDNKVKSICKEAGSGFW